jgi:acetyl-CoA carboxylase carboxyltransferase component
MGADQEMAGELREAELEASYRSAEGLGFDELLDPGETRNALLHALHLAVHSRQSSPRPVTRTAITP